jgi:hypothetical protein
VYLGEASHRQCRVLLAVGELGDALNGVHCRSNQS